MPLAIHIDAHKRLILTTMFGTVTDDDVIEHVDRFKAGQEHSDFDELVHSRGEIKLRVTEAGVERVAAIVASGAAIGQNRRLAIVAKTALGAQMARYYRTLVASKGTIVRTFETYGEALGWLRPPIKNSIDHF